MKIRHISKVLIALLFTTSCGDYLDVIPDNIPTIDHAFIDRISAQKFLATCYSYLPNDETAPNNPAMVSGECWIAKEGRGYFNFFESDVWDMFRDQGFQTVGNPISNYWDGGANAKNLWIAIRDCNIFLENIYKPQDLTEGERARWIAEVTFLKAYYHYYLWVRYGPIPITDTNILVSAGPDKVRVYRDPSDDVVDYIVSTIDKALPDLFEQVTSESQELGRITKPIALAIKAKCLAYAASPLYNGNPYYANYVDNRGVHLFPVEYKAEKWQRAAVALKEAIDVSEKAGHKLYYYDKYFGSISDSTKRTLNIRLAVTDRWNKEVIWGRSAGAINRLQINCDVRTSGNGLSSEITEALSPTLETGERFYSDNGVPIDEDKTWQELYKERYQTQAITSDYKYYMWYSSNNPQVTAKLHFRRETRFYASLNFDRGTVYGKDKTLYDTYATTGTPGSDKTMEVAQMRSGETAGRTAAEKFSITGYTPKKMVALTSYVKENSYVGYAYPFPIVRLADLYLLYAEVLNEVKSAPDDEVYKYIDLVRKRASLEGVVDSWKKYSLDPNKPLSQDGMREIIHRERANELAFEGQYYWDIRRWKTIEQEFAKPIRGWSVTEGNPNEYYKVQTLQPSISFSVKDYFWPISQSALDVNRNLEQNPEWK